MAPVITKSVLVFLGLLFLLFRPFITFFLSRVAFRLIWSISSIKSMPQHQFRQATMLTKS